MFPNLVQTRFPDVELPIRRDGQWATLRTGPWLAGRKVVIFGLPGAFTPTCSSSHVPRYQELHGAFRARGVDEIVCVSVNDPFVMEAWQADQQAPDITFLPDGNGTLSEALGLLVDKRPLNFGARSWRYALVVDDGVITQAHLEPEKPGDPFEVSDADSVLRALDPAAQTWDVLLFTKPGCAHCARAKAALTARGLPWAEVRVRPRMLHALPGARTTPQVFVNGAHLGGADALIAFLDAHPEARGA
jgi:peroxiredoxin/glutaredoxin